jgi:hypothetical protein
MTTGRINQGAARRSPAARATSPQLAAPRVPARDASAPRPQHRCCCKRATDRTGRLGSQDSPGHEDVPGFALARFGSLRRRDKRAPAADHPAEAGKPTTDTRRPGREVRC